MSRRRNASLSSRKEPRQARSIDLVATILEAAIRVLVKEGAAGFTTARVAERAGVSVGSLYQYFPNKAAILFRLQSDEWQQTTTLLRTILEDESRPPLDRLRALVHAFLRSECEEAPVRIALDDAAPLYRDTPDARAAKSAVRQRMLVLMEKVLPAAPGVTRAMAAELIMTTLSQVGKSFSERRRAAADIEAYANAMADMFIAYLERLG